MAVEHCQVVFKSESSGESFHFPVNPGNIAIHHRRSITKVPVLGLGEVILPGSLSPASISFEALLPRPEAYDDLRSVCNYRVVEKPEESVGRFERWMGRTQYGQVNPEIIRVDITGSGFSRKMVLTEVSAEYRPGEPDALYARLSLEEWKVQSVKITQGADRPLLPERPGIVSPVSNSGSLNNMLPDGENGGGSTGLNVDYTNPTHHTTGPKDTYYKLWQRYGGDEASHTKWATRFIVLNDGLFQPGGKYYQQFEYFDLNGTLVSPQLWLEIYNSPLTTPGDRTKLESSRRLKYLSGSPLHENRLPPATRQNVVLPFPCVLELPKVGGSFDFGGGAPQGYEYTEYGYTGSLATAGSPAPVQSETSASTDTSSDDPLNPSGG